MAKRAFDPKTTFCFRISIDTLGFGQRFHEGLIAAVGTPVVVPDSISTVASRTRPVYSQPSYQRPALTNLRQTGADPVMATLLPAIQAVKDEARRSTSSTSGAATRPAGGWHYAILPQMEQQNAQQLKGLILSGQGGVFAVWLTVGYFEVVQPAAASHTVHIKSNAGDFAAVLEGCVIRVDRKLPNDPGTLVCIGFSRARRS